MSAIFSFVKTWQITIYIVLIALSVGFLSGWYVAGKFQDAKEKELLAKSIKATTQSTKISNKIEENIVTEKAKIEIRYVKKIKEIIKYVPETVYKQCVTEDGNTIDTTLNVDAVRVLNDEPSPSVQPANIGNAESKTLTEVGLRELSEHILAIRKQYQDLAKEHDGLVDYNNEYKKLINQ